MNFYFAHRVLPVALLLSGIFLTYIVITFSEGFAFIEAHQRRQGTIIMLLGIVMKFIKKNIRFTPAKIAVAIAIILILAGLILLLYGS